LELPEEMAWPNQTLPLFGIEWGNLPSFTFVIQTPKFVSFPSFSPPPISFYLVSPSPRLQVLEKISTHVFLEFRTLMEKYSPSGSQDTNHNPRNVEVSNLSTCPFYTLCYLFLDISIFQRVWNLIYGTPLKKHKMEIPIMIKKQYKVSGNEIQMTLED